MSDSFVGFVALTTRLIVADLTVHCHSFLAPVLMVDADINLSRLTFCRIHFVNHRSWGPLTCICIDLHVVGSVSLKVEV